MQIVVRCTCGAGLRLKDEHAGRRSRCPKCRRYIQIPDAAFFELHSEETLALEDLPAMATPAAPGPTRMLSTIESGEEGPVPVFQAKPFRYSLSLPATLPVAAAGPAVRDWVKGETVDGKYRIFGSAKGAQGRVYFAEHLQWQQPIAIKTILPKGGKVPERRVARFRRETEAWIDLGKHPNLVTAFYLRQMEGRLCLFLEYVEGEDLFKWTKHGLHDLGETLDLAIQISEGMAHAHARGIVHRDLKPSNVLLSMDGVAKVTDFGLVKFEEDGGSAVESQHALGTPAYMSPEQFFDSRGVDARADIYSFGAVLFMMVTGEYVFRPEQGTDRNEWRNFFRHCHTHVSPPSPRETRENIPHSLDSLILRCLRKQPEERYSDFLSLKADLLHVYAEVTGSVYPREQCFLPELNSADLNNRALTFMDLDEPGKAMEFLEEAYTIDPGSPIVCTNLCLSWAQLRQRPDALTACFETARSGLEQQPERGERLAAAALGLHLLEDARKFAEAALQQSPAHPNLRSLLAVIAVSGGDYTRGRSWVNQALKEGPGDTNALHTLAILDFEIGDFEAAGMTLHRLVSRAPENTDLAADLAVVLACSGRPAEALNWAEYATALEPANFRADIVLAEILSGRYGSGEFTNLERAAQIYQQLFALFPQQVRVRHGFVRCLTQSGESVADEIRLVPRWYLADYANHQLGRLVRSGRPSPYDQFRLEKGEIEFLSAGPALADPEDVRDAEAEVKDRLNAAALSAVFLALSPNGQWMLTAEGPFVRLRAVDSLTMLAATNLEGALPAPDSILSGTNQASPESGKLTVQWSTDSRFCLIRSAEFGGRVIEFSTAADLALSPCRFPSPSLLPDRSATAGETLQILEERQEIMKAAAAAEQRWDYHGAFKNYRAVQSLRGFERDFDAHAGATRAGNWISAPAALRNAWERKQFPLRAQDAPLARIAVLADGKRGLSLCLDGRLRLSDLITGHVLWSLEVDRAWVQDFFLSPDSSLCLLCCSDGVLRVLNLNSQVARHLIALEERRFIGLRLSADSRSFYSLDRRGLVEFWQFEYSVSVRTVAHLDFPCHTALFSNDGKLVLAATEEGDVCLVATDNGAIRMKLDSAPPDAETLLACLTHSSDRILFSHGAGTVQVWQLGKPGPVRELAGHPRAVTALAADSKGRHAAVGTRDGSIRLWNLDTGASLFTFSGHRAPVTALAFSPNDEFFLSGDESGALKFWTLDWSWEFEEA